MSAHSASAPVKPPVEWGLDPLFWVHLRVLAHTFHTLRQHIPGVFLLNSHPIRRVEVVGVCVERATSRGADIVNFTLDDGTGTVPCTLFIDSPAARGLHGAAGGVDTCGAVAEVGEEQTLERVVALGTVLRVRGRPKVFRDQLQVIVASLQPEGDPDTQALHWLDCVQLAQEVYKAAPVPPDASTLSRLATDPVTKAQLQLQAAILDVMSASPSVEGQRMGKGALLSGAAQTYSCTDRGEGIDQATAPGGLHPCELQATRQAPTQHVAQRGTTRDSAEGRVRWAELKVSSHVLESAARVVAAKEALSQATPVGPTAYTGTLTTSASQTSVAPAAHTSAAPPAVPHNAGEKPLAFAPLLGPIQQCPAASEAHMSTLPRPSPPGTAPAQAAPSSREPAPTSAPPAPSAPALPPPSAPLTSTPRTQASLPSNPSLVSARPRPELPAYSASASARPPHPAPLPAQAVVRPIKEALKQLVLSGSIFLASLDLDEYAILTDTALKPLVMRHVARCSSAQGRRGVDARTLAQALRGADLAETRHLPTKRVASVLDILLQDGHVYETEPGIYAPTHT